MEKSVQISRGRHIKPGVYRSTIAGCLQAGENKNIYHFARTRNKANCGLFYAGMPSGFVIAEDGYKMRAFFAACCFLILAVGYALSGASGCRQAAIAPFAQPNCSFITEKNDIYPANQCYTCKMDQFINRVPLFDKGGKCQKTICRL